MGLHLKNHSLAVEDSLYWFIWLAKKVRANRNRYVLHDSSPEEKIWINSHGLFPCEWKPSVILSYFYSTIIKPDIHIAKNECTGE